METPTTINKIEDDKSILDPLLDKYFFQDLGTDWLLHTIKIINIVMITYIFRDNVYIPKENIEINVSY